MFFHRIWITDWIKQYHPAGLVVGWVRTVVSLQKGQGGVYRHIAGEATQEIVNRLGSYLEYRSFRNRDWRLAMGTPSTDKILELFDHFGLDASEFSNGWEEGW